MSVGPGGNCGGSRQDGALKVTADRLPIARKIMAGRPRPDPAVMTVDRALHIAFARAAEHLMKLPLRMPRLTDGLSTAAEITEILPDNPLLLLLDGPDEALGLMALGSDAFSALIEMMMLHRLADHPPPPRRPTRTDALMISGYIDQTLAECEGLMEDSADIAWLGGFRHGAHLADARPLALMLEDPVYRVFRMTLAFGMPASSDAEIRTGEVVLCLPAKGRGAAPPITDTATPERRAAEGAAQAQWQAALERAILPAPAEVRAIVARVSLPLAQLVGLEAGQFLPLPGASLGAIQVETADDRLVGLAELGQGNGHRALRLAEDIGEGPIGRAQVPAVQPIAAAEQPMSQSAPPASSGAPGLSAGQAAAQAARHSRADAARALNAAPAVETSHDAAPDPPGAGKEQVAKAG